jgi:hypothetical protein
MSVQDLILLTEARQQGRQTRMIGVGMRGEPDRPLIFGAALWVFARSTRQIQFVRPALSIVSGAGWSEIEIGGARAPAVPTDEEFVREFSQNLTTLYVDSPWNDPLPAFASSSNDLDPAAVNLSVKLLVRVAADLPDFDVNLERYESATKKGRRVLERKAKRDGTPPMAGDPQKLRELGRSVPVGEGFYLPGTVDLPGGEYPAVLRIGAPKGRDEVFSAQLFLPRRANVSPGTMFGRRTNQASANRGRINVARVL